MSRIPSDTHPDAQAVQIQLLRDAGPAKRFALLCSLTSTTIYHAKRAIERANPELNSRERDLLFVEIHYGHELAEHLREFLERST